MEQGPKWPALRLPGAPQNSNLGGHRKSPAANDGALAGPLAAHRTTDQGFRATGGGLLLRPAVGISPPLPWSSLSPAHSLTTERRESATNGHWLGPRRKAAFGSESGRSDNAPQTADSAPKPTPRQVPVALIEQWKWHYNTEKAHRSGHRPRRQSCPNLPSRATLRSR